MVWCIVSLPAAMMAAASVLSVLSGGSASRECAADGHRAYSGVSIASVKASAQYPGGRMCLLINVCVTT